MNILFASTHGSLTAEMGILCQKTGNKMFLLTRECTLIPSGHAKEECEFFAGLGIKGINSDEEFKDKIKDIDFMILVTPQQILASQTQGINKPFAIIGGGVTAEQLSQFKIRSFLSPSKKWYDEIPGENKLLYPKLIWKERFPNPRLIEDKSGFGSYVHWLERFWKKSKDKLDQLNKLSKVPVFNYGAGSEFGIVNDIEKMNKSKATVHIKDKGLTCNAPIRSLAVGTPVLMDKETFENGYFDNIRGFNVFETLQEMATEIEKLNADMDYLEEKSIEAEQAARQQFIYRQEYGEQFKDFLNRAI